MEKKKTVITTIRIPVELQERIKVLATKRLWSVNQWIKWTLEREARPR